MEQRIYDELIKDAREYFCNGILNGIDDSNLVFNYAQTNQIDKKTVFSYNSIQKWFVKGKEVGQENILCKLCFYILRYWKENKEEYKNIEEYRKIPELKSNQGLKEVDDINYYIGDISYKNVYIEIKKEQLDLKGFASSLPKTKDKKIIESQNNEKIERTNNAKDETQSSSVEEGENVYIYVNQEGKDSIIINNLNSFWGYYKTIVADKRKVTLMWGVPIFAVTSLIVFLFYKYTIPPNKNADSYWIPIIFGAQFLLSIMVFLLFISSTFIRRSFKYVEKTSEISLKSYSQFYFGWISIWGTWSLLYLGFTLSYGYDFKRNYLPFADFLNALSTIFVFYMFLSMDMKSVNTIKDSNRNKDFFRYFRIALSVVFAATVISICDRFFSFKYENIVDFDNIGTGFFSLISSVSMMYLFGRMDSFYFKMDRFLLGIFYLYAGIQVLWEFATNSSDGVLLVFFVIVFVFKIIMGWKFFLWFQDGDFRGYFDRVHAEFDEKTLE